MIKVKSFITIIIFTLFSNTIISAKAKEISSKEYRLDTIFEAENKTIWSFDFISDTEIILGLKEGKIYYFNLATAEKRLISTPVVHSSGQGGLLDIHFKKIDNKSYVYFTYSLKTGKEITTALARGQYVEKSIINIKTIFKAKVYGDSGRHFGSRLIFNEEYIFMTIGERGERKYAQNLAYHNGKILRLTYDGKAAKGNPFTAVANALPEIWSYGHRNPQGIDINPVDNKIYSVEFGPRGGDELNLIAKGNNYGWPVITYGHEYHGPKIGTTHKEGMQQPLVYWTPSISPSGMVFYRGDKIPQWKNNIFVAALGSTHLRRLVLKNGRVTLQQVLLNDLGERFRHVRNSPDGYLYFCTDSGKIIKISPR